MDKYAGIVGNRGFNRVIEGSQVFISLLGHAFHSKHLGIQVILIFSYQLPLLLLLLLLTTKGDFTLRFPLDHVIDPNTSSFNEDIVEEKATW